MKCDKLVVYHGRNNELVKSDDDEKDDSYSPVCSMALTQGYTHVQIARRGTPFRPTPWVRDTRGRQLGNLKNSPSYVRQHSQVIEEQQYASNIIPNAEINVDTEMPYEDWLAAQGLVELQQSPLKDTKEEENDSMVAKQIDSIHMTLDVIYKFIQDNIINPTDRDNIHSVPHNSKF